MIINSVLKQLLGGALLYLALAGSAVNAGQQRILVLGDSISAAYGMSLAQGWVALLAGRLAESHPQVTIANASISGETTAGALLRLPDLLAAHTPDIVVVELGANDGLRGYPIAGFRSNLSKIVELSQQQNARVILVQMDIPPNYGTRYTRAFHDSYSIIANSTDSALAPFILDGVAGQPALIQRDGIHPTAEAQPRLLDNILPTLTTLLDET